MLSRLRRLRERWDAFWAYLAPTPEVQEEIYALRLARNSKRFLHRPSFDAGRIAGLAQGMRMLRDRRVGAEPAVLKALDAAIALIRTEMVGLVGKVLS